jgi:hypothetical protein
MIGKSVQVSFWICIFRLFGFLSTFPLLYISHCFEEPSFLFWREINCFVKETNSQLIIIPPPFPILDYKLMPYVEILNDLTLIESKFYDKIKYGTSDLDIIKMLKEVG